jgi:hypothetical protein
VRISRCEAIWPVGSTSFRPLVVLLSLLTLIRLTDNKVHAESESHILQCDHAEPETPQEVVFAACRGGFSCWSCGTSFSGFDWGIR